jgi:peptidoglycan/xylan/chitin deacetylase (PgdA/CDA1 family)
MAKTLFLLYHDLDSSEYPSEKKDLATKETVARLQEFEAHMAYLAAKGRNVISMKQFIEKQAQNNVSDKDIVLSFDDGHMSNHRLAFPVLQKYDFHATFFIIADRIGAQYHMSQEDLLEFVDAGMDIGSHGLTHTYLPNLSQQKIEIELSESKKTIEDIIHQPVRCFAYPGGHYDDTVLKCIRESDYTAAASCIVGWNNSKTDLFLLRRVEIRRGTSVTDFERAISSNNIFIYQGIDRAKSGIKKIVGLKNYETLRKKIYFLYPFKR